MNKRGESNMLGWNLALIIIMLFVFIGLDFFVYNSIGNSAVLEDRYAKKISLMIDQSKPGTTAYVDLSEGTKMSMDYGIFPEIYIKDNEVFVKLTNKERANSARFYSSYQIRLEYLKSEEKIRIEIKDENE